MLVEASENLTYHTHLNNLLHHPIIVTFVRVLIIESKLSFGQLTRQSYVKL